MAAFSRENKDIYSETVSRVIILDHYGHSKHAMFEHSMNWDKLDEYFFKGMTNKTLDLKCTFSLCQHKNVYVYVVYTVIVVYKEACAVKVFEKSCTNNISQAAKWNQYLPTNLIHTNLTRGWL